ncbi:MAG TPA: hypothetical protein VFI65_01460 [Streptosporangiaceae bacterium]|nr:hypothetical protein [Streptosporangiaceae bacterium]
MPVPVPHTLLVAGAVAVTVLGAIVASAAARSALGRRVLLIFAVVIYTLLINLLWPPFTIPVTRAFFTFLPPLAVGAVALRAASRSRRRGPNGSQPA